MQECNFKEFPLSNYKTVLKKQLVGFAITGTLSTLLMLGIYVGLNKIINYQYSYLVSYCLSVVALYFMNALWVFNQSVSVKSFLQFPLIYLLQYVVGAISLEFLVKLGVSVTFAPVVVVIILLPVTFMLNRFILLTR